MSNTVRVAPGHHARIEGDRVVVTADDGDSALRPLLEQHLKVSADAGSRALTLGGRVVAHLDSRASNEREPTRPRAAPVTAFEARFLADTHAPLESADTPLPFSPRTDLHSHFAAALTGRTLVELACAHDLTLDAPRLQEVGIHVEAETPLALLDARAHARLARALDLPVDQQSFFLEMERRYRLRSPLTKARALFVPQLHAIAEGLAASGVRYAELSLSETLEKHTLAALHAHLDEVEARTGTRLRFLVALHRDDDTEWDLDVLERLRSCIESRAVAGIDIMGHETCATERVRPVLEAAGRLASLRPGLVVRVHAGENPAYPQNVRQAVEILRPFPGVELRIGHGLFGVDDALLEEMARAPERIIVELNLTSNLALNNIQSNRHTPLARLLDAGVSVVLGTDGAGLYGTDARDEVRAALLCGASATQLSRIAHTEQELIERKDARERTLPTLRNFAAPEPLAHVHYTDAARERLAAGRADRERALAERITKLGARVVTERPSLAARPLLWLAGAWKNAFAEWTDGHRTRVALILEELARALAARDAIVVTGGTRHGVEGMFHACAAQHGVSVYGAIPDDILPDDLDSRVHTFWRCAPSMWGKAEPVVRLVRDVDGFALFVGGGLIVADEEQAAANLGVRHAVLTELPGVAARALEASRRTPFVDGAAQIVAAFDARTPRGALRHEGANHAVDVVAIREGADGQREVLLIVRHDASGAAAGVCALPGGFRLVGEDVQHAAARVLARETHLAVAPSAFQVVCTVDGPGRDPRDTKTRWVSTTLLRAHVDHVGAVVAGGGAARARFVALKERPALAFDHDDLVTRAMASLDSTHERAAAHADPRDSTT